MNVATITMDPEQAKAKLKAYRANKHKDAEKVYHDCAAAYAALADEKPLVDLDEAIRAGGFDDKSRPKLAVARADAMEVQFVWRSYDSFCEFDARSTSRQSAESLIRRVDLQRQHGLTWSHFNKTKNETETFGRTVNAYAMVPIVPADVRPATGQLKDWFILWEVDHWADRSKTALPSRDPFLLKHVGGTLYAILAEWDLTDLEMAIMKQQGIRR